MQPIYLDHCATTPVDPEVMGSMMRHFGRIYGNPASSHAFGRAAAAARETARTQTAELIGAMPEEIVFTSGGTEADNLAILGTAAAAGGGKNHVITSAIEHPAVINACRRLASRGYDITFIPADENGIVDPFAVAEAVTEKTFLISIMHANNETGVIEPIAAIGALARQRGVLFHTDAVQSVGKIPFEVNDINVDLLSMAAHKFYGPKGVGALYVRKGTPIAPILLGGGQEGGRRGGTENIPGIMGLGKACECALRDMTGVMDRHRSLRDRLEAGLCGNISHIRVNAVKAPRLPHVLSVSLLGLAGDLLVRELDRQGIAASAGAACHADKVTLSHVLAAMGMAEEWALGTIRFSVGKGNTEAEIDRTVAVLAELATEGRK